MTQGLGHSAEVPCGTDLPKVSFKATDERSHGTFLKESITHLFWEVVYFLLLPLEAIRYLAVRVAIVPSVGSISKKVADRTRNALINGIKHGRVNFTINRLAVRTADRVTLDTCELVHPDQPKEPSEQKWIVFFNGNGSCYEDMLPALAKISEDTGVNIYTGNYRGVGYSKGFPWTAKDLIFDGEAMVQRLLKQGVKPENILLHGWSIGGGVATAVAAKHPEMHLCSDRSFSTFKCEVREMVGNAAPQILHRVFAKWKDETIEKVAKAVANIAAVLAHFIGWDFDSVTSYDKVTGNKFVMHHPCDAVIPHRASLYYGLKQKHMTEADQVAKKNRVPLKAKGQAYDEYPKEYKPSRIRLNSSSETWTAENNGPRRAEKKHSEIEIRGVDHHISFLSLIPSYSDGYREYLTHVRSALALPQGDVE